MVSPSEPELEALRREVDRIDRAAVELLADRLRVVRAIAALKGQGRASRPAIRPGREAVILRRLVAQAGGRFPTATLVRMWRELLAATTRAQAPLTVAACVPPDRQELWDLVRDHFGSSAPILRAADAAHGLRLVAEGAADLVVMPLPGDAVTWWTGLSDLPLRIVARLPFVWTRNGEGALVVGNFAPDPSGDDLTVVVLAAAPGLPGDQLPDLFRSAGLAARTLTSTTLGTHDGSLHLIEIDGFVEADDHRLAAAHIEAGGLVLRCAWLGGYARPLAVGD